MVSKRAICIFTSIAFFAGLMMGCGQNQSEPQQSQAQQETKSEKEIQKDWQKRNTDERNFKNW